MCDGEGIFYVNQNKWGKIKVECVKSDIIGELKSIVQHSPCEM